MAAPKLYPQEPIAVAELAERFRGLSVPWWIVGGWAIDLFVGYQTRNHEDIDVCVLRRDQAVIHQVLSGWDIHVADPPGTLRPWEPGEWLDTGKHDVWCRKSLRDPWSLWVMLNESEGDLWVFRRDPSLKLPITVVIRRTADGIPYFAPELQLLFKAKNPRTKDESDFARTLPLLDSAARLWLRSQLRLRHPDHPWLSRLIESD